MTHVVVEGDWVLVLVETLGDFADAFAFFEDEGTGVTAGALHGVIIFGLV